MQTYEHMLTSNSEWALSEGSRHFEGKSAVQDALKKIARRLDELQIPYAIVGGMALFHHGFRRFTEDVDILVKPDDLQKIHAELSGRGYLPPFTRSKNLRDTEFGVRIEFLVAGQYPGDGKPKEVAFPDPATVAQRQGDIAYVDLKTLVELKVASGISDPNRLKDLADVLELIKLLRLPAEFGESLAPSVQSEFQRLWQQVHAPTTRYLRLWPKGAAETEEFHSMLRDGVVLEPSEAGSEDDVLVTTDPATAKKYDMHPEDEFFP